MAKGSGSVRFTVGRGVGRGVGIGFADRVGAGGATDGVDGGPDAPAGDELLGDGALEHASTSVATMATPDLKALSTL